METNKTLAERYNLRQADWQDAIRIQRLLNAHALAHRYLDWRNPVQWLGTQPFLLLEEHGRLQAAMACPTDPPEIAWVRLFACSWDISLDLAWKVLFTETLKHLTAGSKPVRCFVLALEDWFDALLLQNNFRKYQEIIILQRELDTIAFQLLPNSIIIHQMVSDDLSIVETIDGLSFEDLWVYSAQTLGLAFQQSDFAYIAEIHGKPAGYLLGTKSGKTGHLARIAVLPENKRQHIATRLIHKLIIDMKKKGMTQITLNTQSNNQASLALYDKMGFRRTGEIFGVYQIL